MIPTHSVELRGFSQDNDDSILRFEIYFDEHCVIERVVNKIVHN